MNEIIPAWDTEKVLITPWTELGDFSFWVVLMGFAATATCGWVGTFLLLRRMALIGDAISHSILPGLVLVFLLSARTAPFWMFVGAVGTGLFTVWLIEVIHHQTRLKPDAAICLAFTTLFAAGVLMLSFAETKGPLHIDAECLLYGDIALIPLEPPLMLGGIILGPPSVWRMILVGILVLGGIVLFYKEWVVTSFDPGLAQSLGMRTGWWHYALTGSVAVVIVAAFEAVGAILAIAMLIVPPMFAAEWSQRLPFRLVLTTLHAFWSALTGYHLSIWLNCSTAGAMVVSGSVLFVVSWGLRRLQELFQIRRPSSFREPATLGGAPG